MILVQVMHPYHEKSATFLSLSSLLSGKKTKPLHIHEAYSVLSMEDDWDLQAVVRRYSAATTITNYYSTSSAGVSHGSSDHSHSDQPPSNFLSHSLPFEPRNDVEELQQLCDPFFPKSHTRLVSPVSAHNVPTEQKQNTQLQSPRSKRRKNQLKKVCRVTAESLSSSVWAWRKYGQKPIKGSPYPRGYYRCSSSKECLARKQVERDRSDSGMFIVTYTAEHNHPAPTHRNSLAGSTRQKPSTSKTVSAGEQNRAQATQLVCFSSSGEDGVVRRTTETERKGEKDYLIEDEEDEQGSWGDTMAADDDFFLGLEDLDDDNAGDNFPENYSEDLGLSWIANDSTTAGGGS